MRLLTQEGRYLTGDPESLLRNLASQDAPLRADCLRLELFRTLGGPRLARHAALQLIEGLEQDGKLVLDRGAHRN